MAINVSSGSVNANDVRPSDVVAPVSLACWGIKTVGGGSHTLCSFNKGNSHAQYFNISFSNNGDGTWSCGAQAVSGSTESATSTNTVSSTGVWDHYAGTFGTTGGGTIYAYLNGDTANRGSVSATKVPSLVDSYAVGSPNGLQASTTAILAHACWWNEELTSGEIEALASGIYPWQIRPHAIENYVPGWIVDGANDTPSYWGYGNFFTSTGAVFDSREPPMRKRQYKKIFLPAAAAPAVSGLHPSSLLLSGVGI